MSVGSEPVIYSNSEDIPYNIEPWTLESLLEEIYGTKDIDVVRVIGTNALDKIEMVIEYVGIVEAAQTITIDTTLLLGGSASDSFTAAV